MHQSSARQPPRRSRTSGPADGRSAADGTAEVAVATALARLPRVADLLAARAEEHDRDATFPYQGVEALHEAELLTLTVAQRFGGPGAALADTVRALAVLGRGDASVAMVAAATLLQHAEQARTGSWPAAAYRKVLTESRRGPVLLAALTAEPGEPGATGLPGTLARRDGDGWLLTGRKSHCTGVEGLAWMAVRARTDEPVPRVGTFLVRGDSPGVELDPGWDQLGLRAGAAHDVVLTGVQVGADGALGLAPADEVPEDGIGRAWRDLALCAVHLGTARAAQDWLAAVLRGDRPRTQPAAPAGSARRRIELGKIEACLIGAEELVAGLADGVDRGDPSAVARSRSAPWLVHRDVTAAVQQTMAISGSVGLSRRHPLERYLRDALSARAHFPSEEDVLEHLGRTVLERRP